VQERVCALSKARLSLVRCAKRTVARQLSCKCHLHRMSRKSQPHILDHGQTQTNGMTDGSTLSPHKGSFIYYVKNALAFFYDSSTRCCLAPHLMKRCGSEYGSGLLGPLFSSGPLPVYPRCFGRNYVSTTICFACTILVLNHRL